MTTESKMEIYHANVRPGINDILTNISVITLESHQLASLTGSILILS